MTDAANQENGGKRWAADAIKPVDLTYMAPREAVRVDEWKDMWSYEGDVTTDQGPKTLLKAAPSFEDPDDARCFFDWLKKNNIVCESFLYTEKEDGKEESLEVTLDEAKTYLSQEGLEKNGVHYNRKKETFGIGTHLEICIHDEESTRKLALAGFNFPGAEPLRLQETRLWMKEQGQGISSRSGPK